MERSFVMIKPDGVERRLIGEIISRFEKKGFKIVQGKIVTADIVTVEKHYEEHKDKPFFSKLVDYILEGPVMPMVLEGENVVEIIRLMVGNKEPRLAAPGTIRGDFSHSVTKNIIHASDSIESAEREIRIWFAE
ncbi:nucleoside-diphosphate kinase [Serpentinicella alkaliphila]|uniref:Nucleoside diphosphate kinase n=1 Tax=Serpentinicella alkaliphila TaxID=1734049 RepID=A0A4R2TIB6_9FIRM|nr:nucleoside-diphosphate kinase [Serpentinicella alkaliphila]QUH25013.1 nucleoside-diphosphate kinase [Serpentinicella alkaliphila]TCQ02506.1 nucleoside diphosphate kinase [Serpentinicella alkaliphila]